MKEYWREIYIKKANDNQFDKMVNGYSRIWNTGVENEREIRVWWKDEREVENLSVMKPYTQDEDEDGNPSLIFHFFFSLFLFIPIRWRVNLHEEMRETMMTCEKRGKQKTEWILDIFSRFLFAW